MKTICLSMIVKNESKIIERMLQSVLPVIDAYCIVDTGSTDDTVEIIHKFAAANNLKGHVVHDPFVNFEVSRTRALAEARKLEQDYILLMDADMVLEGTGFTKDLTADLYMLYQGSSSLQYLNARLVSSKLPCKYSGVTHEYLNIDGPHSKEILTTIRINDVGDGGAKHDKFARDIRLLTKGLEDEPGNVRYLFYLANSYFDSGNPKEAVPWYQKRIEAGGWNEEVFYSMYRLCLCFKILGNMDMFLLYGLKAWLFLPTRVESIYELVKYHRENGNQKLAYSLYLLTKDVPAPPEGLFVHMDVYRYKLTYEFSILAFYCQQDARQSFRTLFVEPELDLTHLLSNYKFYLRRPAPIQTIDLSCAYVVDGIDFTGSSPSIVATGSTYVVNVRLINYTLTAGNYKVPNNQLVTRNVRLSLDSNLQVAGTEFLETEDVVRQPHEHACTWHGIEDVKVAEIDGALYFTGTKCLESKQIGVCWGKYENPLVPKELPTHARCEKNWVFLPDRMEMVYSWAPLKFGPLKDGMLNLTSTRPMPHLFKMARGSCNGVEFNGEYWFTVHFVLHGAQRFYLHALAVFDRDMHLQRYTLPFKFRAADTEYCLGMVVEAQRILFTHSETDSSPQLAVYPLSEFEFVKL